MASSWGSSWGTSWHDSWGVTAVTLNVTFNVSPLSFTADTTHTTADCTNFTVDRTGADASRGEPADSASFSVQVGEAQQAPPPTGSVGYTPQRRSGDVTVHGEVFDVYVSLVPGDASEQTNVVAYISAPLFVRAELICGNAFGEDNLEDDEVIALILAEAA